MSAALLRRAVFLDRDGTLIQDEGYLRQPDQVRLLPGVGPALRGLAERGFLLVVVSNQSGVGRGWITPREAQAVHARFVELLRSEGVELSGSYYCPHAPEEGCPCRKPAPGLLLQAAEELAIDLGASCLVGDRRTDLEAARAAGSTGLLLGRPDLPAPESAHRAADWNEALAWILERQRRTGE